MTVAARDALDLAAILREAAQSEVLPRFRRLGESAVRIKSGPLDLVTDADEAAERRIAPVLAARFPGTLVVGEEAAAADPGLLDRLAAADRAIVLDPIDGTFNYASGVPLFGVMAALLVRGEAVLSVIYDPVGDDAALAVRAEGAWIQRADGARRDLSVAGPTGPGQMTGIASWQFLPEPMRSVVCANLPRLAATWSYRCAAHEYRLAAAGHCHFLLYHRLLPWDHAPGWLLHREAGGYSAHFDGTPYRPSQVSRGLICAPDRESWGALRETLLPGGAWSGTSGRS
jgi:fructose-1,6-bisphosphatase/inositol monophosphatase family enzyme